MYRQTRTRKFDGSGQSLARPTIGTNRVFIPGSEYTADHRGRPLGHATGPKATGPLKRDRSWMQCAYTRQHTESIHQACPAAGPEPRRSRAPQPGSLLLLLCLHSPAIDHWANPNRDWIRSPLGPKQMQAGTEGGGHAQPAPVEASHWRRTTERPRLAATSRGSQTWDRLLANPTGAPLLSQRQLSLATPVCSTVRTTGLHLSNRSLRTRPPNGDSIMLACRCLVAKG